MNSFSIIVPVYNVEKYLEKCIDTLIEQNYNNYEIIIVNDGSTDNSKKIIDKYEKEYSTLIKSYNKKNGGLSSARNFGINKSNNDYLIFVDSDDYIDKSLLNILDKYLINNKKDIVVYNYCAIYDNTTIKTNTFNNSIKDDKKRYLISNPSACNKVFKRTLFDKIKFKEGIYYEDLATIPKLIKYTNNIGFIDDALYYYLVRNESITNKTKYNKHMDDIFDSLNELNIYLNNDYKEEIEYLYIEHLLRNASLRYLNYKKYDKINNIIYLIKKNYPKWNNNIYYKELYNTKQKIMCELIIRKQFFLISILRIKVGKKV